MKVLPVNQDGPTHQCGVATIAPLPESVAQQYLMVLPQSLFLGQERAAKEWLPPKDGKEPGGDAEPGDLLRFLLSSRRRKVISPSGVKDRYPLK